MSYSLFQGNEFARVASWLIGILGILGNISILIYICKVKSVILPSKVNPSVPTNKGHTQKSSKVTDFLVCNLAIADILGCTYLIIIAAADTYYGYRYPTIYQVPFPINQTNIWAINPFCFIARYAFYTSSVASITITLLIAVDRFIVVLFPHSGLRLNLFKCRIIIMIVWFLLCCYGAIAIVIGLSSVLQLAKDFRFSNNLCLNIGGNKRLSPYLISRQVIYYAFCALIMLCYCAIIAYLRHKKTKISSQMNAIERRIFIMMLIITASNVFSLLPSTILFSNMNSLFRQRFNMSQQSNQLQNWSGTPGWNGWWGSSGTPGWNGWSGSNGTLGWNGKPGWNGTPGPNGKPGLNGTPGWNGWSGSNGKPVSNGKPGWNGWNGSSKRNRSTLSSTLSRTNGPPQLSQTLKASQQHLSLSPTKISRVRIDSRTNNVNNWRNNLSSFNRRPGAHLFQDSTRALVTSSILTFINAVINPIIYFYFSWSTNHRKWHWLKLKKHSSVKMNANVLTKSNTESSNIASMQHSKTDAK